MHIAGDRLGLLQGARTIKTSSTWNWSDVATVSGWKKSGEKSNRASRWDLGTLGYAAGCFHSCLQTRSACALGHSGRSSSSSVVFMLGTGSQTQWLGSFRFLLLNKAKENSLLPGLPDCPGAWLQTPTKLCWELSGLIAPLGELLLSFPFLRFPELFNVHVVSFEHRKVLGSRLYGQQCWFCSTK